MRGRLSDGYLVRTNESLYSVQSMANIRIRLIFDSSNTLVNRLGPKYKCILRSVHFTFVVRFLKEWLICPKVLSTH